MNVTLRQLLERVRNEGQPGLPWPAVLEILARLAPLLESGEWGVRGHLRSAFVEVDHQGTVSIAARTPSPATSAPEQLDGGKGDPRTDVYGLGLLAWELLTGTNPFERPSDAETVGAVRALSPSSLALLRTDVPRPAAGEIERALKKSSEARPATVRDFVQAIGVTDAARSSPGLGALVRRLFPQTVPPPPRPPPPLQTIPTPELISPLGAVDVVTPAKGEAGSAAREPSPSPSEISVGQPVGIEKSDSPKAAGVAFGIALLGAAATALWFLLT